jgi:AcrR family transcriptional regulator
MTPKAEPAALAVLAPIGRPRSEVAQRAILDAFQDLLIEVGFARLRLEHVAARAGTSKATIYRRWSSKEELAIGLLRELGAPRVAVTDRGSARAELIAVAMDIIGRLTASDFGAVIRRLLCEIAGNPAVGEPFRASVIDARRDEIRDVIERGIARGDIRTEADPEITTELLAGSIYFRSLFGGPLDPTFAENMVDALLAGYGVTTTRQAHVDG